MGEQLELEFLNTEQGTLQYLPFGATSIGFTAKNNTKNGFFRPENHLIDDKTRSFVGFADDSSGVSKDFLVIWGAGKDDGQYCKQESRGKMYLELIHIGDHVADAKLTLEHSSVWNWRQSVNLVPVTREANIVKMINQIEKGNRRIITFCGEKVPSYYCRWWPPNPAKKEKTEYLTLDYPKFEIRYSQNSDGITSSVEVFLDVDDRKKKICIVQGDLDYAFPHAEIFAFIPELKMFVLRLWLYWTHRRANDSSVEIPDIERFDFVVDAEKFRVLWYGTDFHYQEYWSRVEDKVADAQIAKGIDIVAKTLENVVNRAPWMVPEDNYNPIEEVKGQIWRQIKKEQPDRVFEALEAEAQPVDLAERGLQTRTHVPFVRNCKTAKGLISSVISG